MDLRLKDRIVLVTGGSKGIGFRIVRAFLEEGCDVAFCARSGEDLQRAAEQLKSRFFQVTPVQGDVCRPEDPSQFVN
jgi:NAD(P)-dependent dehydrogenase (short-subunit alcohol dehydrogenase family)